MRVDDGDWAAKFICIEVNHNNNKCAATGMSPNEALYGFNTRIASEPIKPGKKILTLNGSKLVASKVKGLIPYDAYRQSDNRSLSGSYEGSFQAQGGEHRKHGVGLRQTGYGSIYPTLYQEEETRDPESRPFQSHPGPRERNRNRSTVSYGRNPPRDIRYPPGSGTGT